MPRESNTADDAKDRRPPITIDHDTFDRLLAKPDPVGALFNIVEGHFYGMGVSGRPDNA